MLRRREQSVSLFPFDELIERLEVMCLFELCTCIGQAFFHSTVWSPTDRLCEITLKPLSRNLPFSSEFKLSALNLPHRPCLLSPLH